MEASTKIKDRIKRLDERLARYIPPRETWTPAEEALFVPLDLYRVPLEEARAMQLKAIKYAFTRHYTLNQFYRSYCETKGFTPENIRTYDDLEKVPLVPDLTFKQHPSGKDFAYWITGVFTGDLPRVVIKGANPSFDDIINAFNAAGLVVAYSTGTSGRYTVIPRDMRTYMDQQYAQAKLRSCLGDVIAADHVLLFFPKWTQTNLFIGRDMAHKSEMLNDVRYALDFEISADMALRAMTDKEGQGGTPPSAQERRRKVIDIALKWLERYKKTSDVIDLEGGPFIIVELMETLEQGGKRFEFGERGMIGTGGGWKVSEDKRVSAAEFRKRAGEVLGIPETNCFDQYGSVEMGGMMNTCSEGHYFHVPYTWFKPVVLGEDLTPVGYGERGRFAFLDGLARSYPGFIMTGDEVRMHEHCPVCDRPGPVLEPEIHRAKGQEVRGCAEELRRVFAKTLRGGT
ncbi:MAG: LuxE/PaaK family acyltransferase [Halobacteriota archaeon]